MSQLEDLLQQCTVKLSLSGRMGWGTGFFVAPGWVLTCAHVVQEANGEPVQVWWQQRELAAVVERSLPNPYDLALLQVVCPSDVEPPCVCLDEEIRSRDPLYLFGYPYEGDSQGEPRTFYCDGVTGSEIPSILFNLGQVRPGMSGSPLLNQRTGKVCGIVKFTRDRSIDLGGGAIPTRVILAQFPQLRDLQQVFHGGDRRWVNLITTQSGIDFQPYREAVIYHYSQQRHLYTPTDALLPLEAQSVERQAQDDGQKQQPEKTVEQFPVLDGLRKYALGNQREHVLLAGRPGSGKSTALRQLTVELAKEGQVPILVQLKGDRPVLEAIASELEKGDLYDLEPKEIKRLLRQQRFVLLLDGVNEIPNDPLRRSLIQFRQENLTVPMIFTTRDLMGSDLGIGKRLEMKPLSEPQMQEFVGKYLPEQGDRLLGQLRDRLRELAETPLLLKLLCDVFDPETNQIPKNKGELFQQFDRDYRRIKKEIEYVPVSENFWEFKSEILQYLAFRMIQGEVQSNDLQKPPETWLTIHKNRAAEILETWLHQRGTVDAPTKAKLWLKDLCNHDLLQDAAKPDEIEFHHQLFQEYYAAEYLLRLLQPSNGKPRLTDDQLKQDYLNYLKWTEPIALMLALVDEEAHALRVVRMALDVDWKLGAKLAGKVLLDFQAATVGEVIALRVADWLKVELLGQTQSKVAIPELLSFLKHPSINIAEVAASYIGETQDQEAIDILAKRLEEISLKFFSQKSWGGPDRTGNLWTTHVRALAYLSPQAATHFLRDKLEKHDTLLLTITDAAPILMQLGAESLIPELLKDFQNAQQEEKRKLAANVQEAEVEIQMPELWDSSIQSDSAVLPEAWSTIKFTPPPPERLKRNHILNLLENSSDYELFVPTLIEAFEQEPDESIQGQIIQILGKSQYDAAIHLLVQKLGETNGNLRSEAVKQLIKQKSIDNPNSLEELHKLVDHEDWNISWCAAIVLGHLKHSTVLPRMMYELDNHQIQSIRSIAARVLGIIGDPNCVPSLLKAINQDTDRYVRLDAACSLSSFGQKEAIPILLDALKSPTNADPHSGIMKSISRFCIKEPLLNIVKSKRLYWQRAAVELGRLSKCQRDDKFIVLPDLFDALVDPGHESSNEIIDLLSELADSETLNRLIDALEHPEKYTSDIYFPSRVALVLVGCCPEMMVNKLFTLRNLSTRNYISQLFWLIPTIQYHCKLYNYEIAYGIIPQGKTIALYFSSAPSDAELQTQLANHLNLLERQEIITSWHHRQMLPGADRAQVINDRLNSADIILLLISADSISDHTCYDIEINRAMERHQAGAARVIPILLRPVDWQGAPFSQLPVLPRNQQPVTSWGDRDAAFQEIAEGIREVAIELRRVKDEGAISSSF